MLEAGPHLDILEQVSRRALAQTTQMIVSANHREVADKTDPKVGGHPAACSSSLHLLTSLHLVARQPQDIVAGKPHAAPLDHILHHHLGLYRDPQTDSWMDTEKRKEALTRLRHLAQPGQTAFQSYHAHSDPDSWNYLPTGSVGIPATAALFLALAYRVAESHGHDVPEDAHFWSLVGDSEFREGSLLEALPEATERGLDRTTWILDYNRQNLDGIRIGNNAAYSGTDADRIEAMVAANGWKVLQLRHGRKRLELFKAKGGDRLRDVLTSGLDDFELQMLLYKNDGEITRKHLLGVDPKLASLLDSLPATGIQAILRDLGGHDFSIILDALATARNDGDSPYLIIAHTLKGFGLEMAGAPGNHSALPPLSEVESLLTNEGLSLDDPYAMFPNDSDVARFLQTRGDELRMGFSRSRTSIKKNQTQVRKKIEKANGIPPTLGIDLRMMPAVSTQWVIGQIIGKLTRLAEPHSSKTKEPTSVEARWQNVAPFVLTLAPDVGTSTNLGPSMNGKIFGPPPPRDLEVDFDLIEKQRPSLSPSEGGNNSHIRFEITEANAVSAVGAFGKMGQLTGLPFLPVLTIYDFFIKRALDQLYYATYWESSFILIGTPSGVTLSAEGAQHSWKSDLQLPNQIIWEPLFAAEVDWILSDAARRHFTGDNKNRSAVIVRGVTRGVPQKMLLQRLRLQKRFRPGATQLSFLLDKTQNDTEPKASGDEEILGTIREDVLAGGYALIDYRGYSGYVPGDNVVHLFAMGPLGREAVAASDLLLQEGIYANVFIVTSPDLLLGNLGQANSYSHLKQLGVNGDLYLHRKSPADPLQINGPHDWITAAGSRIPIVSVHDGEPGLLDNIGSIVGVRQIALAVRKASKSGALTDVYRYHGLDADSIRNEALQVLAETALEEVVLTDGAVKCGQTRETPVTRIADEILPTERDHQQTGRAR